MPDLGQLALGDDEDEDEEMEDLEGQQLAEMTALLQELRARGLDPDMLVQPVLIAVPTASPAPFWSCASAHAGCCHISADAAQGS